MLRLLHWGAKQSACCIKASFCPCFQLKSEVTYRDAELQAATELHPRIRPLRLISIPVHVSAQGDLLCCETCPRIFHLDCVGLREMPAANEWYCPACVCAVCGQVGFGEEVQLPCQVSTLLLNPTIAGSGNRDGLWARVEWPNEHLCAWQMWSCSAAFVRGISTAAAGN